MSKEAALSLLTGQNTTTPVNPSLVVGELPKTETPVTPETPTTDVAAAEPQNVDSSRLAIFTKKEAALRKEREEFKKERDAYMQQKQQIEEFIKRVNQFDETAKADKMAALKLIGWSDEDIINLVAQAEDTPKDPIAEARKIAQEEAQKVRDELAQKEAQAEAHRNQQAITKLKSDIATTIKDQADKFEICSWRGAEAEAQIYEVIAEHLQQEDELLSVEEAAQMVEELYEEEAKQIRQLKKFQEKVAEAAAAQAVEPEPAAPAAEPKAPKSNVPQPQPKPKTLTNAATATSAAAIPRRETPAQKKERLIKALMNGGL